MKTKNKTRISKITVGRLYNLGNYEHIRVELSLDIPEGESAKLALNNTKLVLEAMNPKPPVELYQFNNAQERLKDPQAWAKNMTDQKARRAAIKEMVKDAKATVAKYNAWKKRYAAAMEMLDNMGASVVHKDCKSDWQDDDTEF